jgi:hypothetical protein
MSSFHVALAPFYCLIMEIAYVYQPFSFGNSLNLSRLVTASLPYAFVVLFLGELDMLKRMKVASVL